MVGFPSKPFSLILCISYYNNLFGQLSNCTRPFQGKTDEERKISKKVSQHAPMHTQLSKCIKLGHWNAINYANPVLCSAWSNRISATWWVSAKSQTGNSKATYLHPCRCRAACEWHEARPGAHLRWRLREATVTWTALVTLTSHLRLYHKKKLKKKESCIVGDQMSHTPDIYKKTRLRVILILLSWICWWEL